MMSDDFPSSVNYTTTCVFCQKFLTPGYADTYKIIIYEPNAQYRPIEKTYWACGLSGCRDKDDIEQILTDLNINAVIGEY